ncbi:MAG: hypothetical protein IPN53_03030 [Comamonadaceae bacterium]|nr:hypothetical protein [Comamonadaceae bacterium]
MSTSKLSVLPSVWTITIGLILLMGTGTTSSQPSQKPLISRDGGGVKPNLMVTLDTSASMDFQHAPEYAFKLPKTATTKWTVTFPNFSFYWMHPYDPGPGYYDGTFKGIVPANPLLQPRVALRPLDQDGWHPDDRLTASSGTLYPIVAGADSH